MTLPPIAPDALAELTHGAAELLPRGGLEAKLRERQGQPLRVKLGFDPTKPDLHLGHAVVLHALRRFQDLGHQVVVILGDFTAMIGDPTGKDATRPSLTTEEVAANAQTYLAQLGLILDLARTEIRPNREWLDRLGSRDMVRLAAQTTVAQMLARDNFARRFERNDPIALHEFLYPLMQGYDSVAVQADLELGGTDQTFNLLMGRQIQEAYDQSPQVVMTFPLLVGTDGLQKMSKSLGNYVGLTEAPSEMYGKVMSIPDSLLASYYQLASGLGATEVGQVLGDLASGELHPRDAKMRLARAIVTRYHAAAAAQEAEESFVRQFQQHQLPEDIPEVRVGLEAIPLAALLVKAGLAPTTSEARRLLQQGGVKRHGPEGPETLDDPHHVIEIPEEGVLVQVGKRRFARLLRG